VRTRKTVILGAGLLALALGVRGVLAETPAAESASTAPAGAGKAGGEEDLDLSQMFRVRARVLFDVYQDLEIKKRSIGTNELGLGFAQPTVSDQNRAEEKTWTETTEVVELLCDLFGEGDRGAWLFVGIGGRQCKMDFGTERVKMEPNFGVLSFGALGSLGELSPHVRLDWEARFTYSKTDKSELDQIPDVSETLQDKTFTYSVKLTAAFNLGEAGQFKDNGVGVEPYLGILYQHVSIDEVYTATTASGTSKFTFDVQSPSRSDVRAVFGLRLLGLEPTATLDLEGSVGAEIYGASFSVNINF
jgi:hypothetical protein